MAVARGRWGPAGRAGIRPAFALSLAGQSGVALGLPQKYGQGRPVSGQSLLMCAPPTENHCMNYRVAAKPQTEWGRAVGYGGAGDHYHKRDHEHEHEHESGS